MCFKIHFCIIFLCILYIEAAFSSEVQTLHLGYFDNQPFAYYDVYTKKDTGIILETLKNKVLKIKNIKLEITVMPLARAVQDLTTSRIDLVAFLGKTPEREKVIDYSEDYIYSSNGYLMVDKNSKLTKLNSVHDLNNETIGIVKNSALCDFFKTNKESLKLEESTGAKFAEILVNKLIHKRVTAIYAYLPEALILEAKKLNTYKFFKMVKIPNCKALIYVAFSKN